MLGPPRHYSPLPKRGEQNTKPTVPFAIQVVLLLLTATTLGRELYLQYRTPALAEEVTQAATAGTILPEGSFADPAALTFQDLLGTSGTLSIPDAKKVVFADSFKTIGNYPLSLSVTAPTSVTLPTTGTLVTGSATDSQTIRSSQTSGAVLRVVDSRNIKGDIAGILVKLSGNGNHDQTGIKFDLSGADSDHANDLEGTDSHWKISREGVATFDQVITSNFSTSTFSTDSLVADSVVTDSIASAGGLSFNSGNNTVAFDVTDSTLDAPGVTAFNVAPDAAITNISGGLFLQPGGPSSTNTVQIGAGGSGSTTPDILALDVKSDSGDPAGFSGAMYYNGADDVFRCYQTGGWVDCIGSGGGGGVGSAGSGLTLSGSTFRLGGNLTQDANFTGSFSLVLNGSSAGLKILENGTSPTFFGIFDVADLSASDKTYTFPDASGTVLLSGHSFTGDVSGTAGAGGSTTLTIGNDKVVEANLKAVDTPNDEECLTYEATGGDFEWQACGGGGGTTYNAGSGLTLNSTTFDLGGALTADANLTGNFNLVFNASGTGIKMLENGASPSLYGIFDVADLSASDKTYTFPNASGTVVTTGNISDITGLTDSQISDTLTASTLTANYVASIANGSGISGGGSGSNAAALTLSLGALTGNWNQTGAFDISLNNSSSELQILENGSTPTLFGIFDVADLTTSSKTYTFPDATGTVITTGNITDITGLTDSQISNTLTASTFTGNYVASVANGSGISGGASASNAAALTLSLGALTADWNQTGAFNISLNNSSAGLKMLENGSTPTLFGIFDVTDLTSADKTYTFPDASGTVITSGNLSSITSTGTLGSLTVSGAIAANGGITFDNTTDTVGAHTMSGTVDANTNIITNIGNTGTDFIASTGALTLAGVLTANGGVSVAANQDITTASGTGSLVLVNAVTNASDKVVDITPSYTGGATDALTYSVIEVAAFTTANASGTDTVNGIKLGNLTDPGTTITSYALNIGSGWDFVINNNGTTISATELNLLDGHDVALVDTNDAVSTAITAVGTLSSLTVSGAIAANGGITFDNTTDTIGAHTLGGTEDANTNIITNIGNTGTDFIASTGALTLAGVLTANGGVSVAANQDITTASGTGSLVLVNAVTNASDKVVDITPSYTGGATDALTYSVIEVAAFTTANASGTDTVNGIKLGNLTDPGATITSYALNIGSGWDFVINNNGTTISSTELNLLDGHDVALVDTNDAVSTAITGVGTLGSLTVSGAIAANGGITFDNTTDTLGAYTLGGTEDANTNIITNIGNTGTDFIASTGALTLAGVLTANGGVSIAANQDITTASGTGSVVLSNAVTNASDKVVDITPSYTGGATDALTYTVIDIAAFTTSNASGTDTVNGLKLGNLTDPGASITSNAINIGSGWDSVFNINGTLLSATEVTLLDGHSSALVDVSNLTSGDGTGATSSGSGLEIGNTSNIGLLQGCADGEVLKWTDATSVWGCAADAGAGAAPFGTSGGVITKTTASDRLSLRYGDAADTQLEIENTTSGTIPTSDGMSIDLTGGTTGIVTDGVDAMLISAEFGNGTANTNSGLHLNLDPVNTPSGDENFYGINIDGITASAANETAINIGTGWDTGIAVGSGKITLGTGSSATGNIVFSNSTNNNTVTLQSGVTSGSYSWTLPTADAAGCLQSNGSGTLSIATCGDVKKEVLTSSQTWTKPTGAVMVMVELWGSGGGGGGGTGGTTAAVRNGGGGGGGGAYNTSTFVASDLGSTVEVTVGAGGTAGTTGSGAVGGNGGAGNPSCFSGAANCTGTIYLRAFGGGAGAATGTAGNGGGGGGGLVAVGGNGSTATGGTGGAPLGGAAGASNSGDGGAGGLTAAANPNAGGGIAVRGGAGGGGTSTAGANASGPGGSSLLGGSGGGAGGDCAITTCTNRGGGAGGKSGTGTAGGGGTAGTAGGGAGGAGSAGIGTGGDGGGGGGSNAAGTGGAGAVGGTPGGGGGGGGAGETTTGGVGGAGGRGEVHVWTIKGTGSDLAEIYGTNEPLEAGDVVMLDPTLIAGVKKTSAAYEATAVGVISTSPGVIMGNLQDREAKPALVALAGRIPVKVNTENGPIKLGDMLAPSSTPGVAMRATKAGQVLGQALTAYDGEGTGTVVAFIKTVHSNGARLAEVLPGVTSDVVPNGQTIEKQALSYFMSQSQDLAKEPHLSEILADRVTAGLEIITPKVVTHEVETDTISPSLGNTLTVKLGADGKFVLADETGAEKMSIDNQGNAYFAGTVTAQKIKADQIEGLEIFTDRLASLSEAYANVQNAAESTAPDNQIASSELKPEEKTTEPAMLATFKKLTVDKATIGLDLTVLGRVLALGGLTVAQDATFQGEAIFEKLARFMGKASFEEAVNFLKTPTFNRDTAGFAVINKGEKTVRVDFESAYGGQPIVNVTLTNDTNPLLEGADKGLTEDIKAVEADYLSSIFSTDLRYIVTDKSASGFTIILNKKAPRDLQFSWTALAVDKSSTFHSEDGGSSDTIDTPSDPTPSDILSPVPLADPPPASTGPDPVTLDTATDVPSDSAPAASEGPPILPVSGEPTQ